MSLSGPPPSSPYGDLVSDRDKDFQISVSREAMLGFLGRGHPHSAAWFMELLMTFEEATGVRAKADPEQAIRLTYVEARDKLAGAFQARRDLLRLVADHLDDFPEEHRHELRQALTGLEESLSSFTFDSDLATRPADGMLERAARAHYEQRYPRHTFDAQPESVKEACRDAVRPVLAAALGGERQTHCPDSGGRRPVVYVREQEGSVTELFATVEEAMDGPWAFEDRYLASAGDPWHCEEEDPETELATAWTACPAGEDEIRITAIEIPAGCAPYPTLEEIEAGALDDVAGVRAPEQALRLTYEEARQRVSGPLHTLASTIGRLRVAVDSTEPAVERDLTAAAAAVGELRNSFIQGGS